MSDIKKELEGILDKFKDPYGLGIDEKRYENHKQQSITAIQELIDREINIAKKDEKEKIIKELENMSREQNCNSCWGLKRKDYITKQEAYEKADKAYPYTIDPINYQEYKRGLRQAFDIKEDE